VDLKEEKSLSAEGSGWIDRCSTSHMEIDERERERDKTDN
jgi:hypothetical protein